MGWCARKSQVGLALGLAAWTLWFLLLSPSGGWDGCSLTRLAIPGKGWRPLSTILDLGVELHQPGLMSHRGREVAQRAPIMAGSFFCGWARQGQVQKTID